MGKSKLLCIFFVLAVAGFANTALAANTLAVVAPGLNNSSYALQVSLDNPASAGSTNSVYVSAEQDKGFNNETYLRGEFLVDVTNLTMATTLNSNYLRFGRFFLSYSATPPINLLFFLQRADDTGYWFFTVWHWDSNTSVYTFTGNGFITGFNDYIVPVKIEFEWQAASTPGGTDGIFRAWKTDAPYSGTRSQIINRTDLATGSQYMNIVHFGMVNEFNHFPGTFGSFDLDEFAFYRSN